MEAQTNATETTAATTPVEAKLSQKDAVYNFVTDALKVDGLGSKYQLPEGSKLKDIVTKEIRKVVRLRLFSAIKAGEIKLSKVMDDSKLKKYCSGLINNWLKKDPRFN